MSSMMPEADQSLGQISDLLGNIMTDSGHIPTAEIAGGSTGLNEDAMKIIEEASAIVEENMKEKFPDLPTNTMQTRKTEAHFFRVRQKFFRPSFISVGNYPDLFFYSRYRRIHCILCTVRTVVS